MIKDEGLLEGKPEDVDYISMLLAGAMVEVVPPNLGVVIEAKGEMLNIYPNIKKVLVYHAQGIGVGFMDISERDDFHDGDKLQIMDENNMMN